MRAREREDEKKNKKHKGIFTNYVTQDIKFNPFFVSNKTNKFLNPHILDLFSYGIFKRFPRRRKLEREESVSENKKKGKCY